MGCKSAVLSGIPLDCGNTGGLKNLWISVKDNIQFTKIVDLGTTTLKTLPSINISLTTGEVAYDTTSPQSWFSIGDWADVKLVYLDSIQSQQTVYHRVKIINIISNTIYFKIPMGDYNTIYSSQSPPTGTITQVPKENGIYNLRGVANSFKLYSFRRTNANMVINGTRDDRMGTTSIKTDIQIQFNRMDATKRLEIAKLIRSDCYVVVQDNNNKYWFIGDDSYVTIEGASGQTGETMGDGNNYNLVLSSESKVFPYELDKNEIDATIGIL